jgi:hypothetical protein
MSTPSLEILKELYATSLEDSLSSLFVSLDSDIESTQKELLKLFASTQFWLIRSEDNLTELWNRVRADVKLHRLIMRAYAGFRFRYEVATGESFDELAKLAIYTLDSMRFSRYDSGPLREVVTVTDSEYQSQVDPKEDYLGMTGVNQWFVFLAIGEMLGYPWNHVFRKADEPGEAK